ncbi:MAG: hypothetical protein HUU02_16840, partial [Bacteroidetes bacterium]|nr:hypothetical protein [Bacteroidota bacterium]
GEEARGFGVTCIMTGLRWARGAFAGKCGHRTGSQDPVRAARARRVSASHPASRPARGRTDGRIGVYTADRSGGRFGGLTIHHDQQRK